MNTEYIGIKDVSRITGLSKSKLYKLTALGLIPHYKPTGKLLFKQQEVIEWVEKSKYAISKSVTHSISIKS